MSNDDDGIYKKLNAVLSKLKIEDLKDHALREFPETSWVSVCELINEVRQEVKSKTVAVAIIEIVKNFNVEKPELQRRLDILKLKELCLSTTRTWFAYELEEKTQDNSNVYFQQTASKIQCAIGSPVTAIRAPFDYDSILLGIKRGHRSITVCCFANFLFVCHRLNNVQLLQSIANGLGYNSVTDCHLSGGHIPSLIQILLQKNGATNFQNVVSQSAFKQTPRRTRFGLDFTNMANVKDHLHNFLGNEEEAAQLRELTLHTKAAQNGNTMYSTVRLSSPDVESSLRKMAEANIIPVDSFFFSMLKDHCKNEMKLNVKS